MPNISTATKLLGSFKEGSLGEQITRNGIEEDVRLSNKCWDVVLDKIKERFKQYIEAEHEMLAEMVLKYGDRREKHLWHWINRWEENVKNYEDAWEEKIPPKMKGYSFKQNAKLTHETRLNLMRFGYERIQPYEALKAQMLKIEQPEVLVEEFVKARLKDGDPAFVLET